MNKHQRVRDTDDDTEDAGQLTADEEHRQRLEDVQWLMSTVQGRRFAYRLLEDAGIYRTSFTGNSATFFNEGRRQMGLELLADINSVAVESYMLMIKEALK